MIIGAVQPCRCVFGCPCERHYQPDALIGPAPIDWWSDEARAAMRAKAEALLAGADFTEVRAALATRALAEALFGWLDDAS